MAFGGGVRIGGAYIQVLPDMRLFQSAVARGVTASAAGLSGTLSRVGTRLTRYVTLPIVAAAAESVKMAATFNTTFAKITVLAGKLGVPLEEAKRRVLALSQATGQDPNGLANALYFAASAGLKTSQIFTVLTAGAKGAEAQLGDLTTLTRLLTGVMNAYRGQGLSAAKAMDIFTAAVKVGAAEPAELSNSLGTVITVAAQMKVSFAQVTAAIATATDVGVPASRAITGLRYVLQNIASPTEKAQTQLKQYGITVKELQDRVQKQGLIQTLQYLAKTFDLNTVAGKAAWAAVIGGARGFVVANTLIGNTAGLALKNLRTVTNSTGDFQKAVDKVSQTPIVKFQKALASLKVAAIGVGNVLLPFVTQAIGYVREAAVWFNKLPGPMKELALQVALAAAAFGPLLKIFVALRGPQIVGWIFSLVRGLFATTAGAGEAAVASETLAGATAAATESMLALATATAETAALLQGLAATEGEAAVAGRLLVANSAGVVTGEVAVGAAAAEASASIDLATASTFALTAAFGILLGGVVALGVTWLVALNRQNALNKSLRKSAALLATGKTLPEVAKSQGHNANLLRPNASGVGVHQADQFTRSLTSATEAQTAAERGLFESVNKTNAGFNDFHKIIDTANGVTVDQAKKIAAVVSALNQEGIGLSNVRLEQVKNLLVQGDYRDAIKILNDQLKVTPQRVFGLIDAMNRARVGITVAEQKQLSAAIAAGDWAEALKILQHRLDETKTKLGPTAKKFFELRDALFASNLGLGKNALHLDETTRKEIRAAVKTHDWALAFKLLNKFLDAHNKKLRTTDKNTTRVGQDSEDARRKSHGLTKAFSDQSDKLDSLRAVLRFAGKSLTQHQRAEVKAAVAAHDWAKALRIVRNRLKDQNVDVEKTRRKMTEVAQAHQEATTKVIGLNKSYGRTIDLTKQVSSKTEDLTHKVKDVPTHRVIQYQTPGLSDAITNTQHFADLVGNLVGTVTVTFNSNSPNGRTAPPTASGGIAMTQQIRSVAENNKPEAIIPLDRIDEVLGGYGGKRGRGRRPIKLVVGGREFDAYMEETLNPLTVSRPFNGGR